MTDRTDRWIRNGCLLVIALAYAAFGGLAVTYLLLLFGAPL